MQVCQAGHLGGEAVGAGELDDVTARLVGAVHLDEEDELAVAAAVAEVLVLHGDSAGAGEEAFQAAGEVGHGVVLGVGLVAADGRGEGLAQTALGGDGPEHERRLLGRGRSHGGDSCAGGRAARSEDGAKHADYMIWNKRNLFNDKFTNTLIRPALI